VCVRAGCRQGDPGETFMYVDSMEPQLGIWMAGGAAQTPGLAGGGQVLVAPMVERGRVRGGGYLVIQDGTLV
jgi:hypothetical protein